MSDRKGARPERRHHPRIAAKGAVILHVQGRSDHGRLANVGEGGMFVATRVRAPDRLLARDIELELRLDGSGAEWLHASGRIVRLEANGLAIAFRGQQPAMIMRMIDELARASHAHDRVINMMLIDSATERRSAMAAGFRTMGFAVVEAATPLEAIVRLGESTFELDVIAVADTVAIEDAEQMRAFVRRNHPHAKLITIGDDIFEPDGFASWLSSSNPDAELPRLREALLQFRDFKRF
jgi:hypothetical protein